MNVDYLIVGSGLTGTVISRTLADAGREVLVVDRRSHMGGNVHDHAHASGIRIHTYGPHYFRTSSDKIWDWATRFGEFYSYEAALLSDVEGD
ncbi:FAD-binding protein, partial [bacterium]|nr:FAD-binding protein [bacterium]